MIHPRTRSEDPSSGVRSASAATKIPASRSARGGRRARPGVRGGSSETLLPFYGEKDAGAQSNEPARDMRTAISRTFAVKPVYALDCAN